MFQEYFVLFKVYRSGKKCSVPASQLGYKIGVHLLRNVIFSEATRVSTQRDRLWLTITPDFGRISHTHVNSSKKFGNSSLIDHISLIITLLFDIIRKPVYLSLNWNHICNGYEIMETTLQLVLIESQKWNLAKHCVLAIVQTHWRMKTIGVSLLGNTNELQDFISDLHSYPAALYIPQLHNHNKWDIIV